MVTKFHAPERWAPLVQEFIQQLADPATALYDDSHGTTGPLAQQRIDRAQELHQEYTRMAETVTIPDNRNTNPLICDSNTVDTEACTNPKHKALLQNRTDHDPIVKQMVDMFQLWEENHAGYQRMTSVNQPAASETVIPSHEDADYFDEIQSYHGGSSRDEVKEPHAFTEEEKNQSEAAYLTMAI